MMRIAVVEDDWADYSTIRDVLMTEFSDVEVISIATVGAFLDAMPALAESPPALVIMDMMIRVGEDVNGAPVGPAFRSGARLLRLLQTNESLRDVPVVVHTALDRDEVRNDLLDLPEHYLFVRKNAAPKEFLSKVRALLVAAGYDVPRKGQSFRERLVESIDAKPGIAGFKVDLKKLAGRKDED